MQNKKYKEYELYFDGSCGPKNPGGTARYGMVVIHRGEVIHRESYEVCSGYQASNNVAEWEGFNAAVLWLHTNRVNSRDVVIRGDSMMVINQATKKWKVRDGLYKDYAIRAMEHLQMLHGRPKIEWISRKENSLADELSRHSGKKYYESKIPKPIYRPELDDHFRSL